MTTARPLPDHGTYGRYVGRPHAGIPGCRCEDGPNGGCKEAGRRYNSRRHLLQATGRRLTVEPDRAAAHIRFLLGNGASWPTLVQRGICGGTIRSLLGQAPPRIRRSTEQKILAVRLYDVIAPLYPMPALGSVRRLRALVAIGYQVNQLAAALGSHLSHVRLLLNGHTETVAARFARRIAETYDRLSMTPGTSERSRARAQRLGWAPPLAWDDIDDPAAVPTLSAEEPEGLVELDEVALAQLAKGNLTVTVPLKEKPAAAVWLTNKGLGAWTVSRALGVKKHVVLGWLAEYEQAA